MAPGSLDGYGPSSPVVRRKSGMDAEFLRRVRTVSWIAVALGGVLGSWGLGWRWGAGFALAGVWSVGNLIALDHLVRLSLRPAGRVKGAIALALVIKMPLLYGIGVLIAVFGDFPLGSLLAGLAIPLVVMVLKAGGQLLAPRVALLDPRSSADSEGGTNRRDAPADSPGSEDSNGR